jgi:hypothetical protein
MPDDPTNEVVVIVPEDSGTLGANAAADPSGSESVTEEIIDVILDPFGSGDNSAESVTTPDGVVEEVFVVEPGADSSAAGGEAGALDPTDAAAAAAVAGEPLGAADPATDTTGTGEGFATDPTDTGDLTGTETGVDDSAAGLAADPDAAVADPDAATADPTADTTDPDAQAQSDALSDAQQTQQQDEQAEGQAAASGDYATAQDDAQQAYSASQDVANAGGPDNTDETWQASQDESWANWDQETANEDAQTAESYADDTTGNPDDAADAALYAGDAQNEEATADASGEAGEYGDSLGPEDDTSAVADEAPVDDAPAEESSSVDDDSSAA